MAQNLPENPIFLQPIDPTDPGDPPDPGTPPPPPPPGTPPPPPPPPPPSGIIGTTVFNFEFIKTEASSTLRILAYANCYSGDDLQFAAYLYVDGSLVNQAVVNIILDNNNSKGSLPITVPAFLNGISVGSHIITFSVRNLEPDSPLTIYAGSTIEVSEIKAAAR